MTNLNFSIQSYYFSLLLSLFPTFGWSQTAESSIDTPSKIANLTVLLAERWLVSDSHFDGKGEIRDNLVEYGYYSSLIEVEYALSEQLAAFLHFPFLNYTYSVTPLSLQKEAIWKTGDPEIGMMYNFSPGRSLSVRAGLFLGLPLGFYGQGALSTGDGEFNQMIKLEAGSRDRSFDKDIWWTVYTGINNRTLQYAEEFVFGAAGGRQLIQEKLAISVSLDGIKAIGDSNGAKNINPQSLFSNFRELLNITPQLGFQIHPSLQARIEMGIPISGRNIFTNPSFGLSLFWQNEIL